MATLFTTNPYGLSLEKEGPRRGETTTNRLIPFITIFLPPYLNILQISTHSRTKFVSVGSSIS
jgi:hypothetical protein